MRDILAEQTQASFDLIRALWPQNTLLHENDSFGRLTLKSLENDQFQIDYENCRIFLNARNAAYQISAPRTVPESYAIERIILPFLRLLRGCILLHASAAATPNGALLFLASSGIGKSTLLATLMTHPEIRLTADDAATISPKTLQILPISSQIAMRHDMFDEADFVQSIGHIGYKKLLSVKNDKIQSDPQKIQAIFLIDNENKTLQPISFAQALPHILQQQMALSNPPPEFRRTQFRDIMMLQNIPCYRLGISCKTRNDAENSAKLIFGSV